MSSGHEFFVAPNGNDAWSGARPKLGRNGQDGPFATFRRARDAVRALKAGGRLRGPVTVAVRGGVYRLPEPLVFTAEDSGTDDAGITYAGYEDVQQERIEATECLAGCRAVLQVDVAR